MSTTTIPTPPAPVIHTCEVGFTGPDFNPKFWVRSARTGVTLTIDKDGFLHLPERVIARTAHARSQGEKSIDLTLDDLWAIKSLFDKQEASKAHMRACFAANQGRSGQRNHGRFGRQGY